MDNAERCRVYRAKKKAGAKSLGQRVAELEWQVKAQDARLLALESRPVQPMKVNALAQLRAQIDAVPPRPVVVPNPVHMPVQPFGEWESA